MLKNQSGDFVVKYIGTIDDNYKNPQAVEKKYLASTVNALLNGNEPRPDKTKAIGCSIKDEEK